MEFLRSVHGGLTVAYRADYVATFGGQQFTDILKHLLVVIGQQNTGSGQVSALLLVKHQLEINYFLGRTTFGARGGDIIELPLRRRLGHSNEFDIAVKRQALST
jgi:hypothetical protein